MTGFRMEPSGAMTSRGRKKPEVLGMSARIMERTA